MEQSSELTPFFKGYVPNRRQSPLSTKTPSSGLLLNGAISWKLAYEGFGSALVVGFL